MHGVPGLTVDVFVNGDLLIDDFVPGTIADPLDLPPGTYEVEIRTQAGDTAISGSASVRAGDNVSLVAHLAADGTPALGAFANDTSSAGGWRSRVDVRHAAAAPAVDVYLARCFGWRYFRVAKIRGLENGEHAGAKAYPGHYRARVTLAGNRKATVLGPAPLGIEGRQLYAVYAVGSAADDTLELLVQVLPLRR